MKKQGELPQSGKRCSPGGRFMNMLLVLCVMFIMQTVPAMAAGVNATPSNATVYINGSRVSFEAYNINGSNYFKMRDLAIALNATNKKFNIGYNGSTNTVEITVGQAYVPVGGELAAGDGAPKIATPGKATIHWVEAPSNAGTMQLNYNIALGTYVINGNNFVKLRDLMQWVDVGVGYDSKTASIIIKTNQKYVLPKYTGNPLKAGEAIDNKYRKDYGAQLRTTEKKQKFQVGNKNDNFYTIKTEDGKYLGVAQTVVNGVQVKSVDDEYLWALRSENNNDIFSMRPANNGEMILNAAGEKNINGTWIILWKYDKEDAPNHAEFRFIPVE